MGLLDPLTAVVASFCFLGVLLYKRVNLGVTLTATAILLALLALDWGSIPSIAYTTVDPSQPDGLLAISVILATFGIMWLSQLYRETGEITRLSESLNRLVKNPKIVLSVLTAIIGFLPVAGGALMSAPIVDSEAERLKLKPEKKAYVNLWFRHAILPVYPLDPVVVTTAALTGTALFSIILLQIPTATVMIIVGYLIGFWKTSTFKNNVKLEKSKTASEFKKFLVSFSPIMITIFVAVFMNFLGRGLSQGFYVLMATLTGLAVLILISHSSFKTLVKPLKSFGIYGVMFTVYGAFLLRNVMKAAEISEIFKPLVANGSVHVIVLLTVIPATLGFLTGSPSGTVAVGVSILTGILTTFSPKNAALLYISAYLGYVIAPTHLCFTFTADYFKCPLGKVYKYVIPSFIVTFATALLVYFLPFSI